MAKKMPKIAENAASKAAAEEKSDIKELQPQKAAVSVDSQKAEPKKTKKANKTPEKKPNIFKRMWKGIKGIFSELKKVTWPKGKDVAKSASVVIAVIFAFFVVLFGIDYVLAGLLNLIVNGEWSTIFI